MPVSDDDDSQTISVGEMATFGLLLMLSFPMMTVGWWGGVGWGGMSSSLVN